MHTWKLIFLALCLLIPGAYAQETVADTAEEEIRIDPTTFRNAELGTSRNQYSVEANFMGGMANNVWAYSLAWNWILRGGKIELHIPFTWWTMATMPERVENETVMFEVQDPSHQLIGTGLIYRSYYGEEDAGWFYGGGIRANYWQLSYDKAQDGSRDVKPKKSEFFSLIPLAESGYSYPIEAVRGLGVKSSIELGWILVQEDYETADDSVELPFDQTMPYWTVNFGAVYAF
jgi:hypothetical protein